MVKKINFGLIGAGNIGSATIRYIDENLRHIQERTGYQPVPAVVYDTDKKRVKFLDELETLKPIVAGSAEGIIKNPYIQIIVEATGKDEEALDIILRSFRSGKSVVTPNKLVIAKHMKEIFEEARKYGQSIGFEASVMGGVPIINTIRDTTDEAHGHLGILNGTTNYILTQIYHGSKMMEALKDAKQKGYAEPDPTMDLNGSDTACKNNILTAILHETDVGFQAVANELYREGIMNLLEFDIDFAFNEFEYVVKLLGKSRLREDGKLEIGTYPFLIPKDHPLASISDTVNAVYVNFKERGTHLYTGRGAGPDPTKVALVDDIIRIARERQAKNVYVPLIEKDIPIADPLEHLSRFYLRFDAVDRPGVLTKLSGVLGDNHISIASVIQPERKSAENSTVPVVLLTHESKAGDVFNAINYINTTYAGKLITGKTKVIRIENSH